MPNQPWNISADINGDGAVTISDVGAHLTQFFFLPGDAVIFALLSARPGTAEFFELGVGSYRGGLSGVLSVVFWLLIAFMPSRLSDSLARRRHARAAIAEQERRRSLGYDNNPAGRQQ